MVSFYAVNHWRIHWDNKMLTTNNATMYLIYLFSNHDNLMRYTVHYDMPPLPTTAKTMQCEKSCTKLQWLNFDRQMRHGFHGKLVVYVDVIHTAKSSEIWFIILNCQLLSNDTTVERYQDCVATHSSLGNGHTGAMFTTGNASWCLVMSQVCTRDGLESSL